MSVLRSVLARTGGGGGGGCTPKIVVASGSLARPGTILLAFSPIPYGVTYTYQWQKDGVDISGATSQTLELTDADVSDNGSYRVQYTTGGVTKTTASVVVNTGIYLLDPNNLLYDAFETAEDATLIGRAIGDKTWVAHDLNSASEPNVLTATNTLDLSNFVVDIVLVDASDCGADVSAFATLTESSWSTMLLARYSKTARTGYSGRYLTTNTRYEIGRWTANTYAVLATFTASAPAAGSLFELRCVGSTISLHVNGTQVVSATDSNHTAAGHAGFRGGNQAGSSANSFYVTPYNAESSQSVSNVLTDSWDRESTTYIQTQNTGDYCEIGFTGDYLGIDLSNPSAITGYLGITLNDDSYQRIDLRGGTYTQPVYFNSTSTGLKKVKVLLAGNGSLTNNWASPPTNAVRITGVRVADGETLTIPTAKTKQWVVVGDSISRGRAVSRSAADNEGWAPGAWPYVLADLENADMDFIAFSGQGFIQNGTGGVPGAQLAVDLYSTGRSRAVRADVSKVFVAHGTNDGGSTTAAVATAATATWNKVRTLYPNAKIYCVLPLGYGVNNGSPSRVAVRDARNDALASAFTAWGDANSAIIDITDGVYGDSITGPNAGGSNEYTTDLIHPNLATNLLIAADIRSKL